MMRHGEAFVGIDTAKERNAVAESGREGEIRYLGEFDNTPDAVTCQRSCRLSFVTNLLLSCVPG